MLGWENLFHCEINPFGKKVLDYWYPNSKSYDDITKTDFTEWRGRVTVLTGGFPCQPFSYAWKRRGADDDRYLWPHMFRCIDEIQPDWVVAENVAGILTMVEQGEVSEMAKQATLFDEGDGVRGYRLQETFTLQRICQDLEGHGYAVQPVLIPACAVGAPHRRDRVFIIGKRNISENTMCSGLLHGQDEEQGCERNIWNIGTGDSERICGETSRTHSSYSFSSGEGTPGKSEGIESDRREEDKQPSEWGAETEWNNRFYALLRHAADTDSNRRCEMDKHVESEQSDGTKPVCDGGKRNASDTTSERPQTGHCGRETCKTSRNASGGNAGSDCSDCCICGERWTDFPTVSPIHRGNDGIPFPLDSLTISPGKWRTEALKAYGNAIVPQVMYEIFRAIELTILESNGNR